jgi:hypothetical protein
MSPLGHDPQHRRSLRLLVCATEPPGHGSQGMASVQVVFAREEAQSLQKWLHAAMAAGWRHPAESLFSVRVQTHPSGIDASLIVHYRMPQGFPHLERSGKCFSQQTRVNAGGDLYGDHRRCVQLCCFRYVVLMTAQSASSIVYPWNFKGDGDAWRICCSAWQLYSRR